MNQDLSDDEKKRLAATALEFIGPIADKYELNDKIGMEALYEAFQAGIKFTVNETRNVNKEQGDGGS